MSKRCVAAFGLAVLGACGNGSDTPVELEWTQGQTWYLGASYRLADMNTEVGSVSLDGSEVAVGEIWSDEVVWTYQVVEQGTVPGAGDPLFRFSENPHGAPRALDVIKAWIDPGVNDVDGIWTEADPVVYLVFTSSRQRLAGIVSYTWERGERVERAWSSAQLSRSWAPLSQSMLTAAPTYLAPHGVRFQDGERKLENGHWLSTALVDRDTVDAVYDDELGGGVVSARYVDGKPWPTWTVADNVEISLLDEADVNGRRRRAAGAPPADYDFRAGLSASLDIDASLALTADELAGRTGEFGAPEGYQPWNGSWWPQSKGALVFGYSGRDTLSDRIQADIDPIKKELDGLSNTLTTATAGSESYNTAKADYDAKQKVLVEKLVAFYDGVLADLDGGRLTVADGKLTHADGWSYELDELSPLDKAALALYFRGHTYPNPFYGPAWELLNHYSPNGGSWWGHCNGWSAAAILNFEPTEDVVTTIGGSTVRFTTADVKGLLSETHYSTWSNFFGSRYYKEGDDVADLTPAAFHKIVSFYLRDQQVPLVFDTDATEQVWNFPAYGARIEITEQGAGAANLVNINTADFDALVALPEIGDTLAARIIEYREANGPFQTIDGLDDVSGIGPATIDAIRALVTVDPVTRTFEVVAHVDFATDGVDETHVDNGSPAASGFTERYAYTLVTDADGLVLDGTWDDVKKHPDFAWVPYGNPTTASGSENGYLPHGDLIEALGTDPSRLQ